MTNRYVKVNKVIEYDADGGMFISNSVSDNQEIFFTFDQGRLSEISILLTDTVYSLLISEEELLFIEEQLRVKRWEVMPFSFKKIEKVVWDNYPIMKRVQFSIEDGEDIFTAHYKDWKLHSVTVPFFNSYTQKKEHALLELPENIVVKTDERIKAEILNQESIII
jgi:hypothetical protein